MIKAKYKIPGTQIEIDALFVQDSYVVKNNNRVVVNFNIYDEKTGLNSEPVGRMEQRFDAKTKDFDIVFGHVAPVLDSVSDEALITQPGFEKGVRKDRVITPTYTKPEKQEKQKSTKQTKKV